MIEKWIGALDDYVAEHGYGRMGGAVLAFLGLGGALSTLFGTVWFRLVSVTFGMVMVVLVLLLGIAERRRLYARIERDANMINKYVKLLASENPFEVKKWRQVIEISANGDCVIKIEQDDCARCGGGPAFRKTEFGSTTVRCRSASARSVASSTTPIFATAVGAAGTFARTRPTHGISRLMGNRSTTWSST